MPDTVPTLNTNAFLEAEIFRTEEEATNWMKRNLQYSTAFVVFIPGLALDEDEFGAYRVGHLVTVEANL